MNVKSIAQYRILEELGRGGMGSVYKALDTQLSRTVVIKVLLRDRMSDEESRRRFLREAQAAARLHHTNIVPVFGVGEQDGVRYYVMQYIPGQGLDCVLAAMHRARQTTCPEQERSRHTDHADQRRPLPRSGARSVPVVPGAVEQPAETTEETTTCESAHRISAPPARTPR